MDTVREDSVYITHDRDTVELRCVYTSHPHAIVMTPAEAYEVARDLLTHAAIAEQWKGES